MQALVVLPVTFARAYTEYGRVRHDQHKGGPRPSLKVSYTKSEQDVATVIQMVFNSIGTSKDQGLDSPINVSGNFRRGSLT